MTSNGAWSNDLETEMHGLLVALADEAPVTASYVVLAEDLLDRIDDIVPPGTTINPADSSFDNPALTPAARRRH